MPTERSELRWREDGSVCRISFVTSETDSEKTVNFGLMVRGPILKA
jgi:hypothetical protein